MTDAKAEGLEPESSAGAETTEDVAAESSTADEDRGSLLDAVRGAVERREEREEAAEDQGSSPEGSESESQEAADEGSEGEAEKSEGDELPDEIALLEQLKDSDVPLHKINRFREVLEENKELKSDRERLAAAVNVLDQAKASAHRLGLNEEQVAEYFAWLTVASEDPAKAQEQMMSWANGLNQVTGRELPDDLRQRVDDGLIDEQTAKELSEERARREWLQRQRQADQEEAQQQRAHTSQQQITDALRSYQQKLSEQDPDYGAKHEMVLARLAFLAQTEGRPTTTEGAISLAEKAYEDVNRQVSRFKPAPERKEPIRGRSMSRPAVSAPKSMREAIEAVLERP